MKIAANLSVLDEVGLIAKCINHLRSIGVDLIVVTDAGSTDGTLRHVPLFDALHWERARRRPIPSRSSNAGTVRVPAFLNINFIQSNFIRSMSDIAPSFRASTTNRTWSALVISERWVTNPSTRVST